MTQHGTATFRLVTQWPQRLNAYEFFLGSRLPEGRGGRIALRLDESVVSYRDLDLLVAGYEQALVDSGVGPGDRVLIVMPDSSEFAAGLLAVFRMGAVAVMLNPDLSPATMRAIIESSRAPAAIVADRYWEGLLSAQGGWVPATVAPSHVAPSEHRRPPADTGPDDAAIWLFSGGTTGRPKTVVQTHRSLVNTTRLYGQGSLGLNEDDITMAVPKLYFGYATGSNLLFPLSVGASAALFDEHPTPEVLFEKIARHQPTVLINVPSAVNQMLAHSEAATADLTSVRLATSAGEALPETLYHRWKDRFGVELLDGLGTAEMWHIFITNTVADVRPGTLGRVVPGFEVKVCDEEGAEVGPGEVGRLWVKGDSLGLGYHDDPGQTAEAFRGEWFVGGDLVSIDEEGYVTHRGRADDAIKVKGKWFRPQEVESVLLDHPGVEACAVVGAPDSAGLARPVAFVVPTSEVSEQDLIDWSLQHLEAYKHPRKVIFVEELPQTHLGKVDRTALKNAAS